MKSLSWRFFGRTRATRFAHLKQGRCYIGSLAVERCDGGWRLCWLIPNSVHSGWEQRQVLAEGAFDPLSDLYDDYIGDPKLLLMELAL